MSHALLRTRSAALLAVLLTLGLLGAVAPAGADPARPPLDYTTVAGLSEPVHEVTTETVRVPMHDGIELYVEVTRPVGDGRHPVILEASPYHGTIATRIGDRIFPDPKNADGSNAGLTGFFAPRGYAVVMADLRGTGRSQGCLDHLGPNDAKDLKTIVEWAADQPWSNGKVGMTGHSYVGSTPIAAAAQNPRGLVTIVPSAGLASMYDHQFQAGVPYYLQYAGPQWAYELLALSRHLPPQTPSSLPFLGGMPTGTAGDNFGNDMEWFGCGLPNSALTAGSGQVTGQYEAWHAQRDHREGAADWDGAVFMVHGVNDNAARIPAAEWFFGDRAPREGDKVWLGQWDHGGAGNTRCRSGHPTCRFAQWQEALHAWFDKTLQGRDVDTGPAVEVFLNGDRVTTADRWDATGTPVVLSAAGSALGTEAPTASATRSFVGSAQAGPNGSLDYTSEPLEEGLTVVGLPQLRLVASTTGPVQLVATLYEKVGSAIDLRNPITICALQPLLRHGVATPAPIVPGQPMELSPQCFTAAHHVDEGSSLVLRVSTPNRNATSGAVTTGSHHVPTLAVDANISVLTGPGQTAITLPTVPDAPLFDDVLLR